MEEILTPEQWELICNSLRKQIPELTDNDLQYHEAVEDDMICMVKYHLEKYHVDASMVNFNHLLVHH